MSFQEEDTICALATAPGLGGISVIRVSGDDAVKFCNKLCKFLPIDPESHRIYYGFIKRQKNNQVIDEALVSFFQKGRSFTSEPTVEISCHGGSYASGEILNELIKLGVRLARPGEFTCRAYMKGRIDLVQAEGILDLIESQSQRAGQLAMDQIKGGLSEKLKQLEDRLIFSMANLEANIDFAQEDIEFQKPTKIFKSLRETYQSALNFAESFNLGRKIKEGSKILLLGPTNVGKSSLLNSLTGLDKAIVTDIAGTTRDPVEASFRLKAFDFHLFDSAGIGETTNLIEKIGMDKSLDLLNSTDIVLLVFDSSNISASDMKYFLNLTKNKRIIIGLNKIDKNRDKKLALKSFIKTYNELNNEVCGEETKEFSAENIFLISAQTKEGLEDLKNHLLSLIEKNFSEFSNLVSNSRQHYHLTHFCQSLKKGIDVLEQDEPVEFALLEFQLALKSLYSILGKEPDDEVISRVFKEFCLGK